MPPKATFPLNPKDAEEAAERARKIAEDLEREVRIEKARFEAAEAARRAAVARLRAGRNQQ